MIRPIVKHPDPVLTTVSRPVDYETDKLDLLDLVETTMSKANAMGLAANQIGVAIRAFVIKRQGIGTLCINPEVIEPGQFELVYGETCLSFPWLSPVKVSRPQMATVKWTNENNQITINELFDIELRCFLHELDHINGITIDMYRRGNV